MLEVRYPEQYKAMIGSWLQMNRLSSRNNRWKFKIVGELPIALEEFIEYTPDLIMENQKM
jgi:hypothetical protein